MEGFKNGTDSSSEECWGEMTNKDQRMVKCSAIGFAITLAKEKLWDPLNDETKKNLEYWLGRMNDREIAEYKQAVVQGMSPSA